MIDSQTDRLRPTLLIEELEHHYAPISWEVYQSIPVQYRCEQKSASRLIAGCISAVILCGAVYTMFQSDTPAQSVWGLVPLALLSLLILFFCLQKNTRIVTKESMILEATVVKVEIFPLPHHRSMIYTTLEIPSEQIQVKVNMGTTFAAEDAHVVIVRAKNQVFFVPMPESYRPRAQTPSNQ